MNQDFDDLVHDAMTWFTEGVDAPAGLTAKARRHRRRQQHAKLGWLATGTAVASAAVVAAASVAAGPAKISHSHVTTSHAIKAQTTARVISRVERALSRTALTNPIEHTTQTMRGIKLAVVIPSMQPILIRATVSSTWSRGRFSRTEFLGADGRPVLSSASRIKSGMSHEVWISFGRRVWWSGTYQASGPQVPRPICALDSTARTPAQWASQVRKLLACGAATIEGHGRVDGVATIKLGLHNKYAQGCAGTSDGRTCGVSADWSGTLWVGASSYLPVRLTSSGANYGFQTDFRWLPANAANLAMLHQVVPHGFRHV